MEKQIKNTKKADSCVSVMPVPTLSKQRAIIKSPSRAVSLAAGPMNELSIAQGMEQCHQLTYNPCLKCFEIYNPNTGLWQSRSDADMKSLILAHIDLLYRQGKAAIEPLTITRLVNGSCTVLKLRLPQPKEVNTGHLLAVKNGVLDLSSNPIRLLNHDPAYHLTNGSPVEYQPKSTCLLFTEVLLHNEFVAEDVNLIQRYFGAVLLGANLGQGILLLKGKGGVGKSTLVEIMEKIIGPGNVANLRSRFLSERFELASFIGKKLLVGKDVPEDFLSVKGAQVLKSLVGGDSLQAERKNSNARLDIQGWYHVVITSNGDPKVPAKNDAEAWRRRLLVVAAKPNVPTKVIPNLAEKIVQQEASGILNWLIDGAIKHRAELEQYGTYQLTPRQKAEVESMIRVPGEARGTIENVNPVQTANP